MTIAPFDWGGKGACGDYAPTFSVDPILVEQRWIPKPAAYSGVLEYNHMTRMMEITDGTSNTILLTEVAGRPKQWRAGTPGDDQKISGGPWAGYRTGIALKGSSLDGQMRPGPCAINCTNDHEVYSFHARGANAVFADGTVRFLSSDMSIQVLAALITRAGGEVVSVPD